MRTEKFIKGDISFQLITSKNLKLRFYHLQGSPVLISFFVKKRSESNQNSKQNVVFGDKYLQLVKICIGVFTIYQNPTPIRLHFGKHLSELNFSATKTKFSHCAMLVWKAQSVNQNGVRVTKRAQCFRAW